MRIYVFLTISALLLNACVVSKKKYEASLGEISLLQKQNGELEKTVKANISDFETMKNELHLSNAVKSDELSELLLKVTQLKESNDALENKLEQTASMYQSQKQTSQSTADELKTLKSDNLKLKRDTASIRYALELQQDRFAKLEDELGTQKNKYSSLMAENRKTTGEMEANKQKLAVFEQQLVRNKEKMEAISAALIELRKEMLSAQSGGKSIDPNKNKHIDKMAKELGHY